MPILDEPMFVGLAGEAAIERGVEAIIDTHMPVTRPPRRTAR